MTPISLWNTGVMQLGSLHHKRFSIQQEGVLARLKFMGSGLRLLKISIKTDEI
jgi:hypothetical protein